MVGVMPCVWYEGMGLREGGREGEQHPVYGMRVWS